MVPDDKERFVTVLTGIADYYGKEVSASSIGLYWFGLRQYDLAAVEKAMWAHTQNPDEGQFMPKIAHITKMIDGRTEDRAQLAWTKVDTALRQVGVWDDVAFDDPIIHRVLADMGGWVPLGDKGEKEWPFIAKEFVTRYQGYKMAGKTPEYPRFLTGTANAANSSQGMPRLPVRLIGDPTVARKVIEEGKRLGVASEGPKRIGGGDDAEAVCKV